MQRVHYKLLVIQHGGASKKTMRFLEVYTHRHWTFNAIWSQYACSIGVSCSTQEDVKPDVEWASRIVGLSLHGKFLPSFGQSWNIARLSDLNPLCRLYVYTPRSVTRVIQSVFLIYCSIVHSYVEYISIDQLFAFIDQLCISFSSIGCKDLHQLCVCYSISCKSINQSSVACTILDQLSLY